MRAQMSMKGNHVFRNTDNEIQNICSEWGCKKKHREEEVEGGELPQNNLSYSLQQNFLPVIRLCVLNARKIVHLLFMMSYKWKAYFNPKFQKISIIFK